MSIPPRRPLTFELLADLHAGALDETAAAQLWAQVHDDPHARWVLATLDATVADLAAAPILRMPPDIAARLDTAVAAHTAERHTRPVAELTVERRKRIGIGVLAAAAAAAVVVGIGVTVGSDDQQETQVAAAPPLPLTVRTIADGLEAGLTGQDFGPLADPARRRGCLQAHGVTVEPVGARRVTVDGTAGVLMVLTTGELGRFRVLVVGEDCAPGDPALIADRVVGR